MKLKRGQITVFMILGILMLFFVILFVYINSNVNEKTSVTKRKIIGDAFDVRPFSLFVENCIKDVGYDALYTLGMRGGSIVYEGGGLVTPYSIIDFLYDKGENKVPSKQKMEDQLSLYIENMLDFCLNNLSVFEGYKFLYGDVNISTLILDENVLFKVRYPIKIKRNGQIQEISNFAVELPIRLGYTREIVNFIVENQIKDPGWIDITFMSEFAVNVTIYPYNKTILVYGVIDNKSLINNKPYQFLFANRFEE